jgi:hypothetical protein
MIPAHQPIAPCPMCHQADQVRTLQTAYEAGELRIAPPPMPESKASLRIYLSGGGVLVGIAFFLSITILATSFFSWVQMSLILACLVAAVILAFLGIRRISQGDEETRRRYPLWDQAMANWARLRFCAHDQMIFDPQSSNVLSDSAVKNLLDLDRLAEQSSETSAASQEARLS